MKKYVILGISLFILLSAFVYFGYLRTIDLGITVILQRVIPSFLITPFSLFSLIGTIEIASVILLLILFIFPKLNKISILATYAFFTAIEVFGKSFINQKGPPIEFLKTDISLFLPVSASVPKEFFSYPSGHSSRTAFISGVLLLAIWKSQIAKGKKILLAILIVIFDLLMFISRVYLGEHWVSDVIGGILLGFSFAFLIPFISSVPKKIKASA